MRAVEELGYAPNFGARIMAAKQTFTIGAIIPTMENAIFAWGLQAFQEEIYHRGYTLIVSSSAYQPEMEREQIRKLVSRGADGLLLIGYDRDPEIYDYLEQRGIPAIVTWAYNESALLPCVGFDNRAAMKELTQEVLKKGHQKIGIISAHQHGNDRARERVNGVMDALRAKGLSQDSVAVVETRYGVERGADAFDHLMMLEEKPTAVICGNDVLAVGALRRSMKLGMRVPEDISITGFDDIELARIVEPALSTVHVPHRKMGRLAAMTLVDLIEKKKTDGSIKLKTKLALRDSLGPAPT